MSNKNMEMMKKFLEKKKEKQTEQMKHKPNKKMSSGATAKRSEKAGGANNKV